MIIDYKADNLKYIPSLYRESEKLLALMDSIITPYQKQQEDFIWLSENILNLEIAEKYHLDIIGGLVGQSRLLLDFSNEKYFGFEGSYNSETFGSKNDPTVGGYWNSRQNFNKSLSRKLNDSEYRRIIEAKSIYNNSDCSTNDLISVVNLLTNSKESYVETTEHGLVTITTKDTEGFLAYFVDKVGKDGGVLPIPLGVRVEIKELT